MAHLHRLDVAVAIEQMAAEVKRGEFTTAESIGNSAAYPLAISKELLVYQTPIYEGGQALVYEGVLDTRAIAPDSKAAAVVQEYKQQTTTMDLDDGNTNGINGNTTLSNTRRIPVAIKRAKIRESDDLERFREEIRILAQIARHPGIVTLIGARLLPPEYCVVLGLEATNASKELYEVNWRPGWRGAVRLGVVMAQAVAHLHAHGIIHRDIKPANVLLSSDLKTPKLADLGIAARLQNGTDYDSSISLKTKPTGGFHKQHMVGTLEYMAPELLMKQPHSKAGDIFALAVTINELATAQFPYSDCNRDNPLAHTILEMGYGRQELATAVAVEGLRPSMDEDMPPELKNLLKACLNAVPEKRPSAIEFAEALERLAELYPYDNEEHATSSLHSINHIQPLAKSAFFGTKNPSWVDVYIQNSKQSSFPKPLVGSYAAAGMRGEDKMEDRCLVIRDFNSIPGCTVLAVFDGHRGYEAAHYCSSSLEAHILSVWEQSTSAEHVLKQVLLDADKAFRTQQAAASGLGVNSNAGTTATVALLLGNQLTVANLGDSRAVLCRKDGARDITIDHTADREDERARIQATGGLVSVRLGTWRVGDAGMQVTRSIGDNDLKNIGVSADAETYVMTLDFDQDEYIILATDGLWDKLDGQDALEIIHDTVKQPAMCAQRLVMESLARGSQDNVTSVVAVLNPHSTAERVYHDGKQKYGAQTGAKRVVARVVEDEMYDVVH